MPGISRNSRTGHEKPNTKPATADEVNQYRDKAAGESGVKYLDVCAAAVGSSLCRVTAQQTIDFSAASYARRKRHLVVPSD